MPNASNSFFLLVSLLSMFSIAFKHHSFLAFEHYFFHSYPHNYVKIFNASSLLIFHNTPSSNYLFTQKKLPFRDYFLQLALLSKSLLNFSNFIVNITCFIICRYCKRHKASYNQCCDIRIIGSLYGHNFYNICKGNKQLSQLYIYTLI